MSYKIDSSTNMVFTTATGILTVEEVLQNRESIAEKTEQLATLNELVDLSKIQTFRVSSDDMRRVVAIEKSLGLQERSGRRAIVAPGDFIYGMARMYQILSENCETEIQIFRSTGQARVWLTLAEKTQ